MVGHALRVAGPGRPGRGHRQFRGNEGQVAAAEAEMEPLAEPQFARVPPFRPEPEDASVRAALRILQDAERPVIVAGGGVRASRAAGELVALAEKLSIPVATSLNGKDSIPGVHPLSVGVVGTYSRESANRVVGQADLVCFIGTETGGMTTHFWAVPKIGVRAIQIDTDPEALGRNYPLEASVLGDAKVVLERMLAHADARTAAKRKPWVEQARSMCKEWHAKYGAQLASDAVPERPVGVFTGDAGLWYHIGEIETAVRWKINSVTVVNNNASGNQSKRGFDRVYGGQQTEQARELWTYRPVNFARIAEDIGALGIRVEKPGELAPAIQRALKADRPAIVDVVTDIEALAPVAVT